MVSTTQKKSSYTLDLESARRVRPPIRYTPFWIIALLVSDLAMFVLAAYVAGSLEDHTWNIHVAALRLSHSSAFFIAVWAAMFYVLGLYQRSLALSFKDEFYFTVIALTIGVAPQLLIFTILPSLSTSRMVLLLSAGIAIVLVGTSRAAVHFIRATAQSRRPTRVLIVGSSSDVVAVFANLTHAGNDDLVTLTLTTNTDPPSMSTADDNVGDAKSWLDAVAKWRCDEVILTEIKDNHKIRQFLALCEGSGIKVSLALPSTRIGAYDLEVERKGNQDLLVPVRPRISRPTARLTKRIFDLAFASLAILLSLPVMLVAGLAVWVESGTPIFFRQERVGMFGRIFNIIKFRTMKINADSAWATPRDTRITRVGAFLRRTSTDELPQLFNVIRGDMSLVGPRPEMRSFEEVFASKIPLYVERRLALPGMTGWAQVNMRRNLSPEDVEQVLSLDLFYIKHWSVFLDLTVLLKTAAEFLFHQGV